ncbi:hypothetical protein [Amycolatopsis saalfeldensis]|uniref:Uncharacterized protein n=1 Tax=Amycolatopsis saalfeldensis TaxID=394193 RepID=A0A1H8RAS0_9PSEU|nr:hypothetical protein [Amycolatopsis saalfeldensis]SEO63500.1 hypothetical protein SAMN04489732_101705 [Amycolatopsis saalfeldensis]
MGANEGRSRTAATRLKAVATPELYRRNPFRITGLPATATRRAVRERRLRVLGALEVGGRPPGVPEDVTPDQVRSAFDELGNTEHRLVDEVFGHWGAPEDCDCPPQLHDRHDAAVKAHAAALDAEADRTEDHPMPLWNDAARNWAFTQRSEAFWQHLRHRVGTSGDRRLDESTVDGLRAALPGALVAPLVTLAAASPEPDRLLGFLSMWGVDKATEAAARTEAAGDTFSRGEDLLKELRKLIDNGGAREAAERALGELAPMLDRLERVMPFEEYRRAGRLRETSAIAANNIGVALSEVPASSRRLVRDVFALARRLSTDSETLATIGRNERSATTAPLPPTDVGQLWSRVTTLTRLGRYAEAEQALEQILAHSRRPGDQQQARRMIATMRRLQENGVVPPPSKKARVLLGLLHTALGLAFLSTLLASPLVSCLVIGILGLLFCIGAALSDRGSTGGMAGLVAFGAVVAGVFWIAHASGAAIPSGLTVLTAVLLFVVLPSWLAGRD